MDQHVMEQKIEQLLVEILDLLKPKRLEPPPEEWEECTRQLAYITCPIVSYSTRYALNVKDVFHSSALPNGYRWAWKGDALIIERRKS